MDPNDYVGRRQDGFWDTELKRHLELIPEAARLEFLVRVLVLQEERGLNTRIWLALAGATLKDKGSFETVLRTGLAVTNASSVRPWLETTSAHLGCRRLIHLLKEEESTNLKGVELTHYWLRSLAQSDGERKVIDEYLASRRPR